MRAFNNTSRATDSPSSPTEKAAVQFNQQDTVSPPVEPFLRRVGSTKDRKHKPPPVPDEDGFVRMSPRQRRTQTATEQQQPPTPAERAPPLHKRQISQYDNVNNSTIAATPSPLSNTNTTTTTSKSMSTTSSSYQPPRSSSLKNTHHARTPLLPSVFAAEVSSIKWHFVEWN